MQYEEAIAELENLINPSDDVLLVLAASHARLAASNRDPEANALRARHYIAIFRKHRPRWTLENQREVTRYRNPADADHWLEGLRLAGL